uniref:Uncharacterized protein n=1 Tax=Amphora coffeiformis TaxID=265554 RepID=A0A7S3P7S7_9STRA|eukprot:scaffold936_cov106-Amphora_coffeaeformis.AAC.18
METKMNLGNKDRRTSGCSTRMKDHRQRINKPAVAYCLLGAVVVAFLWHLPSMLTTRSIVYKTPYIPPELRQKSSSSSQQQVESKPNHFEERQPQWGCRVLKRSPKQWETVDMHTKWNLEYAEFLPGHCREYCDTFCSNSSTYNQKHCTAGGMCCEQSSCFDDTSSEQENIAFTTPPCGTIGDSCRGKDYCCKAGLACQDGTCQGPACLPGGSFCRGSPIPCCEPCMCYENWEAVESSEGECWC